MTRKQAAARLGSWITGLFRRRRVESAMNEELRFHMDARVEDLLRSGISKPEAERQARLEFGGVEAVREECRQARGLHWIDGVRADLRYALRMFWRNPGFTAAAVLSLGLGIGANTAIFSLINTVLLKSLPVRSPEQLFFIDDTDGRSRGGNAPPYPCYELLRDHNHYFTGMAAFDQEEYKATIDGATEKVMGQIASGSYFDVLGVPALLGRTLTPADDSVLGQGGPDGGSAVISYGYWQRRFEGNPNVLGKAIRVGDYSLVIVGVTPPDFFGLQTGSSVDITFPMVLTGEALRNTHSWWFSAVGRLKSGVSQERARSELDALFNQYMDEQKVPSGLRDYFKRIVLIPAGRGLDMLRYQYSKPLLIVMVIVAMVLLIGCANVANLLLSRAAARRNEIAVRLAIGAGRARLFRQMLTEGLLLVGISACASVLFARWGAGLLAGFLSGSRGGVVLETGFDFRVLAFTAGVALLTGLMFSIAPALQATRKPDSRSQPRLGRALVVAQIVLSLVLLFGAGIFLHSLYNLKTLDAGFSREGVLIGFVEATLPPEQRVAGRVPEFTHAEREQIGMMWNGLLDYARALPGATSASVSTLSPLSGRDRGVLIGIVGSPTLPEHDAEIHMNQVSAGYFDTLGIGLLAGRAFTLGDQSSAPKVAILNEAAAKFYFHGENPIGRRITFPGQRITDEYEIVGVSRDTRYEDLRKADERMVYLPVSQAVDRISRLMVEIRGRGEFASALRAAAPRLIPGGFVAKIATLDAQVNDSLATQRMVSTLASFFGVLALILSCLGLYGVVSYSVVRRTREIGIRAALGAGRSSLVWMVLGETLLLVALGVVLSLPLLTVTYRWIGSQLFEVAPTDPFAIAGSIAILLFVAGLAGYLPARRAGRVDPMVALRYE